MSPDLRYPPRGYFICECDDMKCLEPLDMTVEEYNAAKVYGEPLIAPWCKGKCE